MVRKKTQPKQISGDANADKTFPSMGNGTEKTFLATASLSSSTTGDGAAKRSFLKRSRFALMNINIYQQCDDYKGWKAKLFTFSIEIEKLKSGSYLTDFSHFLDLQLVIDDSLFATIRGKVEENNKELFIDNLVEIQSNYLKCVSGKRKKSIKVDYQAEIGCTLHNMPIHCAGALTKKIFRCEIDSYAATTGMCDVTVYLLDSALRTLTFPAEARGLRPGGVGQRQNIHTNDNTALQAIMGHYYNCKTPDYDQPLSSEDDDVNALYEACKANHCNVSYSDCNVQHSELLPLLREYQKRAVQWMVYMEKNSASMKASNDKTDTCVLYEKITTLDGIELYYNRWGGLVTLKRPRAIKTPPGGILADEMGLGKTVEVLATILTNRRLDNDFITAKNLHQQKLDLKILEAAHRTFECVCGADNATNDDKLRLFCTKCDSSQHADCVNYDLTSFDASDYLCPYCLVTQPQIPSKTTLIVTPSAISHQWGDEIKRHVRGSGLTLLEYKGVKDGFKQPTTLASYDIILTTYAVLMADFHFVDLPDLVVGGRKLRHAKRFMALPSPLTAVEWWRLCLDEAQMVQATTRRTAEMALRLSAVNRWCVTGTPINKGVDDLYGLLLFLGVEPYWVHPWWQLLLMEPYKRGRPQPLHEAVAPVMWRTCKKDVLDQLDLPEQSQKLQDRKSVV